MDETVIEDGVELLKEQIENIDNTIDFYNLVESIEDDLCMNNAEIKIFEEKSKEYFKCLDTMML